MAARSAVKFGLKLRTKRQKTLERRITKQITDQINKSLRSIQRQLTIGLRKLIKDKIEVSPEYYSLVSATLRGEFGLERPDRALAVIIDVFLQSFQAKLKLAQVKGNTFFANLSINIRVDFERLADIPEGQQEATNQDVLMHGGEVSLLPWLRWLLLEGTAPLVFDYSISNNDGIGRSGLQFLMTYTPGQNFSISNTSFTGTENNNFLTRAINENSAEIERYIRKTSSDLLRRSFKI